MGRHREQINPGQPFRHQGTVGSDVVAAGAAQPGHVPSVHDLPFTAVQEPHLEYRIAVLAHHRLAVLDHRCGHEAPLGVVAAALEGDLPGNPIAAVLLLDGERGLGARSAAAAHDHLGVAQIHVLGDCRVHAAGGDGVDLGTDHDVPRDRAVNGRHGLQHLDGLPHAGVLAAEFVGQREAVEPSVGQDARGLRRQVANLLRLIAAFANRVGQPIYPLQRRFGE